jgi:hypothetical protein
VELALDDFPAALFLFKRRGFEPRLRLLSCEPRSGPPIDRDHSFYRDLFQEIPASDSQVGVPISAPSLQGLGSIAKS